MSDPRTSPSILTRGAVDLGALRAPAPAGPPQPAPVPAAADGSGGAPASGGGAMIIDVTEATFQAEVVERSLSQPVVIDFWAAGSEQSKQLTPVLEKLAVEGGGAWTLARIDAVANPRIAELLRVQSIPTVYAVVGGRPVDAFSGAVPEAQLRPWIAAVLQSGGVMVEAPEDPRYADADEALVNGDLDAAEAAYRKILGESPAEAAAEAGLAQIALVRRVQGVDPQQALRTAEAAPDDVEAQRLAADVEMLAGLAERAYARLVELVRRTSGAERDAARQHLISLFTIAGPDDPAVAAARRALASALF